MDNSCSNIDQQLLNAYRETIYQVTIPALPIQIGVRNAALDAFLQENDATTWAFITAWNPKSQLLSLKENNRRQEELVQMIEKKGYPYFIGKGIGMSSFRSDDIPVPTRWKPEISLFILNISKAEAIRIGKYFDQNAIVFGNRLDLPELVII